MPGSLPGMRTMAPRQPDPFDTTVLSPALRALAARGAPRSYRKGTLIIEEGTQGDTLYLLLSGRVRAFSSDARGREVVYGVYGAGDYFGEMSLDGGPRSASVIADTACT
ncbi:MAG TPA: cyclic nucleotide-binding domain-containing protein, partial [Burkholderiaceae bacterium]|nr:cyclic nucleotide-binding domain-containing protein [Burkholderiaceae bacterium]